MPHRLWIGAGAFIACVLILLSGRHIEHTLEVLNWVLVIVILGGLTLLCLAFASGPRWVEAGFGFFGFSVPTGRFSFFPPGADWFLIGAFAAYSAAGGVVNLTLSNWARDKGFGMGQVVGFIRRHRWTSVPLAPRESRFASRRRVSRGGGW
jgi:hypothetical protein